MENFFTESPTYLESTPGFERQADYEAKFAQDDVFVADSLPDFAKSWILPRKMKKEAVEARMKEQMNPEVAPEEGGLSREKSFDNFKINLLKTSLQHYDSLAQPPPQHEKDKYKGADQGELIQFCNNFITH